MPLQRAARVLLALVVLALAACGGNGEGAKLVTQAVPTAPPGPTSAATISSPPTDGGPAGMAGADLIVGTPRAGESFTKTLPVGTRTTEVAAVPMPTVPPNWDQDGDGFYTYAELEQAIAARYPDYVWPSGYRMDPATILKPSAKAKAQGALFEVRAEYTIIGTSNFCAWELAWLDGFRQGDTALMTQSIEQLLREPRQDPMMDTSSRDYLKGLIKNAQLGDPAGLQQDVNNNCSGIVFITPTPGTPGSSFPAPLP